MSRSNPSLTLNEFLAFVRKVGGGSIADDMAEFPEVVEPFLPKITQRLLAKGLIGGDGRATGKAKAQLHGQVMSGARGVGRMLARQSASGPMTDREAWRELANLVPVALGDQPAALQAAIAKAFLEEAAKAA